MNNQGCAAEILISSMVSAEIFQVYIFLGVGGAYGLFAEYLSCAAVCSPGGETMPSLQSLVHTQRAHTDRIMPCLWECLAYLLRVCRLCAACVGVLGVPSYFVLLYTRHKP